MIIRYVEKLNILAFFAKSFTYLGFLVFTNVGWVNQFYDTPQVRFSQNMIPTRYNSPQKNF
jgi:hypothetical protein